VGQGRGQAWLQKFVNIPEDGAHAITTCMLLLPPPLLPRPAPSSPAAGSDHAAAHSLCTRAACMLRRVCWLFFFDMITPCRVPREQKAQHAGSEGSSAGLGTMDGRRGGRVAAAHMAAAPMHGAALAPAPRYNVQQQSEFAQGPAARSLAAAAALEFGGAAERGVGASVKGFESTRAVSKRKRRLERCLKCTRP